MAYKTGSCRFCREIRIRRLLLFRIEIQPAEKLTQMEIEVYMQLVTFIYVYPVDQTADDHLLRLDAGRIVEIGVGYDLVILLREFG